MMAKKMTAMLNKYFGENLDTNIQAFNLLVFTGVITGIVISVMSAVMNMGAVNTYLNLCIALLGCALLYVAEKKNFYAHCSRFIIIAVFIVAFPVLFFAMGGYKSGMPCFFILALVNTAILSEGRELIIEITIEFILYAACFLTAFLAPRYILVLPSDSVVFIDTIVGFILSGAMLLIITTFRAHLFRRRQIQIEELNRELIARNEVLAQYDRMKSDFLATVAHEINTPLAIISGSSSDSLDLLNAPQLNMAEIKKNQRAVITRVKLIDSILLDLMDTVAIESGRLSLYKQPINLAELVNNTCSTQFKQLDNNNNRLRFEMQGDLPVIWADPARIEQVMTNLLSNAIQYTRDGVITVRLEKGEGSQIVRVQDTGDGMDAETARNVLKQYVSTKADHWRHGIGLYICRRIVTAHGGEIWIDSEKGQGATISFSLKEEPGHA